MSKFPDWGVGTEVSGTNLANGIPNIVVKSANQSRNTTTTLANDSELASIALEVGTWDIALFMMAHTPTSATPDLKTQWSFTGTWNTPLRMCQGPGPGNTATPEAIALVRLAGIAVNANATYGLASSSVPAVITERTFRAVVTAAGNLALQWAQNTSDAGNTTIQEGSTFVCRRIV